MKGRAESWILRIWIREYQTLNFSAKSGKALLPYYTRIVFIFYPSYYLIKSFICAADPPFCFNPSPMWLKCGLYLILHSFRGCSHISPCHFLVLPTWYPRHRSRRTAERLHVRNSRTTPLQIRMCTSSWALRRNVKEQYDENVES